MSSGASFIFPGQGSQYIGMGKDFLASSQVERLFSEASDIAGIPVRRLCMEGPQEELVRTSNLQVCITVIDVICGMVVQEAGIEPVAVAGHSLGEYPALWMAGVLEFNDLVKVVKLRGELMETAGDKAPGSMAAIIGFEREELEQLVKPLSEQGVLSLANHNSREQIVVTGEKELVRELCSIVKSKGKRAVPLRVSGAFHSVLMSDAAEEFSKMLDSVEFRDARVPVYSNVSAGPETESERIRELMKKQMCAPVRWFEIVNNMYGDGIKLFVETGPGKVLTGLVKKSIVSEDDFQVFQVDSRESLNNLLDQIQ